MRTIACGCEYGCGSCYCCSACSSWSCCLCCCCSCCLLLLLLLLVISWNRRNKNWIQQFREITSDVLRHRQPNSPRPICHVPDVISLNRGIPKNRILFERFHQRKSLVWLCFQFCFLVLGAWFWGTRSIPIWRGAIEEPKEGTHGGSRCRFLPQFLCQFSFSFFLFCKLMQKKLPPDFTPCEVCFFFFLFSFSFWQDKSWITFNWPLLRWRRVTFKTSPGKTCRVHGVCLVSSNLVWSLVPRLNFLKPFFSIRFI